MIHGRCEILWFDAAVERVGALTVGGTVDGTTANATAGQGPAEDVSPMVSATARVDLGRASEFSHPDDEGFVEHAALIEVFEEGRVGLVHRWHQRVLETLRVFRMGIPCGSDIFVGLPPRPVDLDQRDTGFDHAPREQHALSETIAAVAVAHGVRFGVDGEGLLGFAGPDQIDRLRLPISPAFHGGMALELIQFSIEVGQEIAAFCESFWRQVGWEGDVGHAKVALARIARDQPRVGVAAEPAGVLSGPNDAAGVPDLFGQSNGTRECSDVPFEVAHDGGHAGPIVGGSWKRVLLIFGGVRHAGQHPIAAGGMRVVVGGHGSQDRDLVGEFRGQRHQFADVQPGSGGWNGSEVAPDFGRRIGFGVPCLVLRRATEQEQHDAVFGFSERTGQVSRSELGCGIAERVAAGGEGLRQSHPESAERSDSQPFTARPAVAQSDAAGWGIIEQGEHGRRAPAKEGAIVATAGSQAGTLQYTTSPSRVRIP